MEQMNIRGLWGPTEWYAARGRVSPYKTSGHPAERTKAAVHWSVLCARQGVLPDLSQGGRSVANTLCLLLPQKFADTDVVKEARRGEIDDVYSCPFVESWHLKFRGPDARYWSHVVVNAGDSKSARRVLLAALPAGDWEIGSKQHQEKQRAALAAAATAEVTS